nr:MAG TPA: hypothetical protein [Caudoviricetes sp.]
MVFVADNLSIPGMIDLLSNFFSERHPPPASAGFYFYGDNYVCTL